MTPRVHRFTVPGPPVSWKRAKRGRNRATGAPISFTDPKDAAHRDLIRAHARNAGIRRPFTGPVGMSLFFGLPMDPLAGGAGDLDNYAKAVKDALKGIAFVDDKQVCHIEHLEKAHTPSDPRTEIEVWGMP